MLSDSEKLKVEQMMQSLGWIKEQHLILGKKFIHYHNDGFEIEEKMLFDIIHNYLNESD